MIDEYWFIKLITWIPRIITRLFHINHRCHYIYDGTFDGGLAGEVSIYRCIWCGNTNLKN